MNYRFAIITGGSKGLGAHLVRRFWSEGFSIGVVSRSFNDIVKVLSCLPKKDGQFSVPLSFDLSDIRQLSGLINKIKELTPHLDVLINNAAIQGPIGPFDGNDLLTWQQTVNVNLLAPVAMCHGLIPLMKKAKGASIINLSGGGATGPRANFSAYATAKTGLVRFSETIAEELKEYSINVNCISPGAMKTEMLREVLCKSEYAGEREKKIAIDVFDGGGASMERVADLAVYLSDGTGKKITGKLISSVWDNWDNWSEHLDKLSTSDIYTLRRVVGRDRGMLWGDK